MLDSTSATGGTVVARLPGDRETLFLIEDAVSEEFSGIASSTSLKQAAAGLWNCISARRLMRLACGRLSGRWQG